MNKIRCVLCGSSKLDAKNCGCALCGGLPRLRDAAIHVSLKAKSALLADAAELWKSFGLTVETVIVFSKVMGAKDSNEVAIDVAELDSATLAELVTFLWERGISERDICALRLGEPEEVRLIVWELENQTVA